MEEIEKRFEIIRAAVDLSDYEVIDIQIRRLRNLSTDKHLHEILQDLERKNFRQALYQMQDYSKSVKDDFFDSSLSDTSLSSTDDVTATISQPQPQSTADAAVDVNLFDLAEVEEVGAEEHIISTEEMLEMTRESASAPRAYATAEQSDMRDTKKDEKAEIDESVENESILDDPLFSLDQDMSSFDSTETFRDDISEDAVDSKEDVSTPESAVVSDDLDTAPLFTDDILGDIDEPEFSTVAEDVIEQDLEPEPQEPVPYMAEPSTEEMFSLDPFEELSNESELPDEAKDAQMEVDNAEFAADEVFATGAAATISASAQKPQENESEMQNPAQSKEQKELKNIKRAWEFEPDEDEKLYEKFAYMDQKFRNMLHQHPQKEELESGVCDEVRDFIHFVSTNDYSESQVEAAISRYQELKKEGKTAEAAQMLIAAATTESTFAQFMLARELFKGEVLQQNYPEAFTQINHLAEEDYPEAICDLGQLYEYGIGIDKNKRHAMLLYEEAAEMGIERARKHYERLKNANPLQSVKSLASTFLKRKNSV